MLCKNGKTSYKTTHNIKLIHLHFGFHNYADISHQTYHSSLKETFSKSWEDFHSSVRSKLSVLRNYNFSSLPSVFPQRSRVPRCAPGEKSSKCCQHNLNITAKTPNQRQLPVTCRGKLSNQDSMD